MAEGIACPVCGQETRVNKVSTIYIHALQAKHPPSSGVNRTSRMDLPDLRGMEASNLPWLGRRLSPPASPRQLPTRPIHPDLMVLGFSAILPPFLFGIYSSQRPLLIPVIVILVISYGFYFWKREAAIAKYERLQAARKASHQAVVRGIDRWMRLYYCAEDDVVFEAGRRDSAPADLIAGYLVRE